jgi:hypothetical protein
MPKLFNIEAEVHQSASVKIGYRVKVSIIDLGIYINGMMVYPPNAKYQEWGVVPPSMRAGRGRYAYIVEFNKKLPLWEEIYDKCVEVAQLEYLNRKDEVISDIDENTPINLDDIPF